MTTSKEEVYNLKDERGPWHLQGRGYRRTRIGWKTNRSGVRASTANPGGEAL